MRLPVNPLVFMPLLARDFSITDDASKSLPASYGPDGNTYLNKDLPSKLFHNMGQYSPRYTVKGGLNDDLPDGCEVTLVNSLERHGVRYMTADALTGAQDTVKKIQRAIGDTPRSSLPKDLRFLKKVVPTDLTADLAPLGALQGYYSGKYTRKLYKDLAADSDVFIRSAGDPGADRLIVTSQFWSMGYHGQAFPDGDLLDGTQVRAAGAEAKYQPDVIISELAGQNNTVNTATCPAQTNYSSSAGENLATATYGNSTLVPVIGRRLEKAFASANVSIDLIFSDVVNLLNLCAFATAADATVHDGELKIQVSPFCEMFKESDFELYAYYQDIGKYYGFGYGDPYHKALAIGYLRELLARLTSTEVDLTPPTGLNTTLDAPGSNAFPIPNDRMHIISGPRIFHDASHDNTMAPIAAAFGLFETDLLPLGRHAERTKLGASRPWKFSHIAPLQGKLVWEKVVCGRTRKNPQTYVRVRANEAIQKAIGSSWCSGVSKKSKRAKEYGLCPLQNIVDALRWTKSGKEWNKCYDKPVVTLPTSL